jgi:hypothetical protein
MAVRDFIDEPATARRPAAQAGHIRLGPGLVDEDEARRIDQAMIFAPARAVAGDVRPLLLASDQSLFLKVIPSRRKKRLNIEVSALAERSARRRGAMVSIVMSDCSARTLHRNAACGLSAEGR